MEKSLVHIKFKALSLMEVLVVLLIIGIITNLVLPKLLPTITKAKSMEAQLQLGHLYALQKTFFYENSKYSLDPSELGFEQEKLVNQSGKANYRIDIIEASGNTFKATATSVTDFDGDGIFNVWEIDHEQRIKEAVKD